MDLLICINKNVSKSVDFDTKKITVHNSYQHTHQVYSKDNTTELTIGMVGTLTKSKGCIDFVKAANYCKTKGYNKIKFLLIGGSVRKNKNIFLKNLLNFFKLDEDVYDDIITLIDYYDLKSIVKIKNFTNNLDNVYSKMDILCFPSYLNAPGRPIMEAGFFKVPSISCIDNPINDTFIDGKTGFSITPGDYKSLANKIIYFYNNPKKRQEMGFNVYKLSIKNFDPLINIKKLIKAYETFKE